MNAENISDLLFLQAAEWPEQSAILHRGRRITFLELQERTLHRAARLAEKGVVAGDRVLIFVPMSIELYEILMAVFHLGASAVFLDAWADPQRLEYAMELADCKAFIGIPKSFLLLLKSRHMRRIPVKLFPGFNSSKRHSESSPSRPDTPALITFTTGSTGVPKAALRTHGFLLEQHRVLQEELALPPGSCDLTTLPIFVLNNLACGVTSLIPDFDPRTPGKINGRKILQEAIDCGATSTTGSPAFYAPLAEAASTASAAIPFRRLFTGGAPVYPDFAGKLCRAFPQCRIFALYGSTEAEPISRIAAEELIAEGCNMEHGLPVGTVSSQLELVLLPFGAEIPYECPSEQWNRMLCPPGEPGEVCVSGGHVLKQYYRNPEAVKANKIKVGDKVFHRTGDAGKLSPDGRLYLLGRVKNVFRTNDGSWCFSMPVENMLQQIPGITCGTILPVPGQGVVLFLECTSTEQEKVTAQIRALGIRFDKLQFLPHLPRDPRHNSKIDYDALKKQYGS